MSGWCTVCVCEEHPLYNVIVIELKINLNKSLIGRFIPRYASHASRWPASRLFQLEKSHLNAHSPQPYFEFPVNCSREQHVHTCMPHSVIFCKRSNRCRICLFAAKHLFGFTKCQQNRIKSNVGTYIQLSVLFIILTIFFNRKSHN